MDVEYRPNDNNLMQISAYESLFVPYRQAQTRLNAKPFRNKIRSKKRLKACE